MAGLNNLDENVRGFLFAIMGGLSMDDVVRQRLEHVSTGLIALQKGVTEVISMYKSGAKISETLFVDSTSPQTLSAVTESPTLGSCT